MPKRAPQEFPLRRPSGAYQPTHWYVEDPTTLLCLLCGRHAATYVHARFTSKVESDAELAERYFVGGKRGKHMGILDQNLGKPFGEHFTEGEVFTLEGMKKGPTIPTIHGEGTPILLKIAGEWYSLFGVGITSQFTAMDDDDRARMEAGNFKCKIVRRKTKSGQMVKLLASPNEPDTSEDEVPY